MKYSVLCIFLLLIVLCFAACTEPGVQNSPTPASSKETTIDLEMAEDHFELSYSFVSPIVSGSDVTIDGLNSTLSGYDLPVSHVMIALPQNTFADSIVIESTGEDVIGNVDLKEIHVDVLGDGVSVSGPSSALLTVQEKGGLYYAVVSVMPCSYDGQSRELSYCTDMKASVALKAMTWDMVRLDEDTLSWLREKVINPGMLDSYR